MKDFEKYGFHNDFILKKVEESKELWLPEIKDLYDWCKNMILSTYDIRAKHDYKGCLQACDAGLAQLRYGIFSTEATTALFDYLLKLGVQ